MAAPMSPSPMLYGCVLPRRYAAALDSPLTTERTREAINASVERVSTVPAAIRDCLTFRETEVLACLFEAVLPTNGQIAERLAVGSEAVKFHLANIYSKLGVNGRREAVLAAVRAGEVSWDG